MLFESPQKAELVFSGQASSWCLFAHSMLWGCSKFISPSLVCCYPLFAGRTLREGESKGKIMHEIWALGAVRLSALLGLVPLLLRYSPFLGKCLGIRLCVHIAE